MPSDNSKILEKIPLPADEPSPAAWTDRRSTRVAFVLDSYRLMHVEQFDAVSNALAGQYDVVGLELFSGSQMYSFGRFKSNKFKHITLFDENRRNKTGGIKAALRIFFECLRSGASTIFISHYERPYIFIASILLRLTAKRVYIISDSKFDDYTRHLWREVGKRIMYLPYQGAIAASPRTADYLRFLGVPSSHIHLNAYTTSVARVQGHALLPPAPDGIPFSDRVFVSVARLVEKKNHQLLLEAYAHYARRSERIRPLVLCGSGPLEGAINARIAELGLKKHVSLVGNLPAPEVAKQLGHGLCLILPSREEQFGIVVLEAQAMGLPVILTSQCGASDRQVRTGVNGFIIEPDNIEGLANFMLQLDEDETLWRSMAARALSAAEQSDVEFFVASVIHLLEGTPSRPGKRK